MPLWITLTSGKTFCLVNASHRQVKKINSWCWDLFDAPTADIHSLPYAAHPAYDFETGDLIDRSIPLFCMHPDQCCGMGSCPRNPACSE